jgi:hypothetical protein
MAQEGDDYRFQPPTPPTFDGPDYDDGMDDTPDAPPDDPADYAPPPFSGNAPPPPNGNDQRPNVPPPSNFSGGNHNNRFSPPRPSYGGNGFSQMSEGKLHFKVIDGQYWQKGKKRERGKQIRADQSAD